MYADPTLMDLAAAYAKRRNGRKTKHAVACERPGAKAKMDRRISVAEGEFVTALSSNTRVPIDGGNGWVTVDPGRYITAKRVRVPGVKGEVEVHSVVDGNRIVGVTAKRISASRPGAKAKMGKYWVEVDADGKTRTIPVASMNEGLRVLRENATERAALRHSGEGMNDILANAAAGGVLLTAAGRLHKSVSSRPGAKAKFSAFVTGDKVTAKHSVQGMKAGTTYTVTDVHEQHTPFGTFVTYELDGKLQIGNGHMLLTKVRASRPGSKSTHAVDYPAMLRALDNTMLEAKANGLEFLQSYKIARQVANSRVLRGRQATAGEILDARKRLEEDMAEEMGQSKHSRPNAKAEMARSREAILGEIKDATITLRETGGKEAEADLRKLQQLKAKAEASLSRDVMAKIEAELDGIMRDWGYFSRPGSKSTHAALPPQTLEAERKPGGGSHSEAVSRKIATLINEGKPQDQAVAIALDLERRGEL